MENKCVHHPSGSVFCDICFVLVCFWQFPPSCSRSRPLRSRGARRLLRPPGNWSPPRRNTARKLWSRYRLPRSLAVKTRACNVNSVHSAFDDQDCIFYCHCELSHSLFKPQNVVFCKLPRCVIACLPSHVLKKKIIHWRFCASSLCNILQLSCRTLQALFTSPYWAAPAQSSWLIRSFCVPFD